jgi:hypothetical protein
MMELEERHSLAITRPSAPTHVVPPTQHLPALRHIQTPKDESQLHAWKSTLAVWLLQGIFEAARLHVSETFIVPSAFSLISILES